MFRKYTRLTVALSFLSVPLFAQQTTWFEINQSYKSGLELLQKEKYAAAAEQFTRVENLRLASLAQPRPGNEITLLQENAQYYHALCALELGNQDAESLFLKFITEHPANGNTKMAYFQVGRSYFAKKNYPKAIDWFNKIDKNALSSKEDAEFRFKLGYSYIETKDFKQAKPLFYKLKNERSAFQEPSIYYYAYLSYLDKDYKSALTEFEKLKGSKAYETSYPYYISAMYFLDKRYDDVLEYAVPVLQNSRQQYETEMFRIVAAAYFAKSDYQNASVYYQKFQQKDRGRTQNNQDHYQIGYTFFKLNNFTRAIEELEKLNTADQFYQNGMVALGQSFLNTKNKQAARNAFFRASKLSFDKQVQEEGLFNYAKLSYELEFHQVALDATQQFLKSYPGSKKLDEAKTLLGEILLSTKNYKEAIHILEEIPNKNREAKEVYQKVTYYRGLEFYNERAFENSISVFMRSNNNAVDENIEALSTYWLAEAMYEVRKYGESVANFEKFLSLPAARKTEVYNYANYALAYSAFENETYGKAVTYLNRFLTGNEKDRNTLADATLRLADSYFVLKNYDNALQYYNRIIANKGKGEDYALFQRGMIQGLQNDNDAKIATHQGLLLQFPKSNYADDAVFEIGYTYFVKGDFDKSKTDLTNLIEKYPRSSYVPRALVTIGLVQYNQDQDDAALETFKRVVNDFSTTDEAQQALVSIKNIYLDRTDADGFLAYANSTNIGNLSTSEQDNITFQAANNRFLRGDWQGGYDAINAYFDKFPRPIHEKHAKFVRAECLVKLGRPNEAIPDYDFILNDWTSDYTERALISVSRLYLGQKKYNEAIVHLKKLELNSEYKVHYSYAINNLMEAYSHLQMPDDILKYADLVARSEKSSEEEKLRAGLFSGKAYLMRGDTTTAVKEFIYVADKTQTITGAEAKYTLANIQYQQANYKAAQKTAFELINKMPSHDYWVAKSFILLADSYVAVKDAFQAKATLQSVLDNYEGSEEDVLPVAKEKLEKLNETK
ncbi:MAG TPA: tetratricopeptide repeat protein [Sphingobacteriaceae bacterium]